MFCHKQTGILNISGEAVAKTLLCFQMFPGATWQSLSSSWSRPA